jgi:hypothetical protein
MPADTTAESPALTRARALRQRLDGLAAGLDARDVVRLLECEAALAGLATAETLHAPVSGERQQLLVEVAAARAALQRCRAIGAANQLLADVTLDALGQRAAYGRDGGSPTRSPKGHGVAARV